jgi:hypothetical protein
MLFTFPVGMHFPVGFEVRYGTHWWYVVGVFVVMIGDVVYSHNEWGLWGNVQIDCAILMPQKVRQCGCGSD